MFKQQHVDLGQESDKVTRDFADEEVDYGSIGTHLIAPVFEQFLGNESMPVKCIRIEPPEQLYLQALV